MSSIKRLTVGVNQFIILPSVNGDWRPRCQDLRSIWDCIRGNFGCARSLTSVRQPVCSPLGLAFKIVSRILLSKGYSMSTDEIFVELVGFPGYSVSNLGSVRSDRTSVKGKSSSRSHRPRILKQAKSGERLNYLFVTLSIDGRTFKKKVAHLVAEAFCGTRPPECDVDHIDGNTFNNSISNLQYLSSSVNRGRKHG
jgi:hypothetical protein